MFHKPDLSQLATERLYMRELQPSDAPAYKEFFDSPQALEFFPMLTPGAPGHAETWMERGVMRYEKNGIGLWALVNRETDRIVGQCGLLVQEIDGITELEVGYNLLPSQWGKGYATEAALACLDYAFKHKLAPSVISIIHTGNVKSHRVAERNGLRREKETVWREMPVVIYRIHSPHSHK